MKTKRISKLKTTGLALVLLIGGCVWYVRANPRVFNESFWSHAYCIAQAGSPFSFYANDHGGAFPVHTNGYGDALLLLADDDTFYFYCLTGPGFSSDALKKAKTSGANLDEAECGRIYVQGLREDSNPETAILFDKLPTPGDHCHGFARLTQPFGREVLFVAGHHQFIRTADWPAFVEKQIKLLIEAGIPESIAQSYYANLPE